MRYEYAISSLNILDFIFTDTHTQIFQYILFLDKADTYIRNYIIENIILLMQLFVNHFVFISLLNYYFLCPHMTWVCLLRERKFLKLLRKPSYNFLWYTQTITLIERFIQRWRSDNDRQIFCKCPRRLNCLRNCGKINWNQFKKSWLIL